MIRVHAVRPASGGFGMFDLSTDSVVYEDMDSAEEHMSHAYSENDHVEKEEK